MNIQEAKQFEQYIEKTSAVKNGGLFGSMIISHSVEMNANKRLTEDEKAQGLKAKDCPNPYAGRLVKTTEISGDCLITQASYEALVNGRLKKEGKPADFKAKKASGRHHIADSDIITQSDKDPNSYYMSLYLLKKKTRIKTHYEIDGQAVNVDKNSVFVDYLGPKYFDPREGSDTQGLENPIIIDTPRLESIKKLKCGDISF